MSSLGWSPSFNIHINSCKDSGSVWVRGPRAENGRLAYVTGRPVEYEKNISAKEVMRAKGKKEVIDCPSYTILPRADSMTWCVFSCQPHPPAIHPVLQTLDHVLLKSCNTLFFISLGLCACCSSFWMPFCYSEVSSLLELSLTLLDKLSTFLQQ